MEPTIGDCVDFFKIVIDHAEFVVDYAKIVIGHGEIVVDDAKMADLGTIGVDFDKIIHFDGNEIDLAC